MLWNQISMSMSTWRERGGVPEQQKLKYIHQTNRPWFNQLSAVPVIGPIRLGFFIHVSTQIFYLHLKGWTVPIKKNKINTTTFMFAVNTHYSNQKTRLDSNEIKRGERELSWALLSFSGLLVNCLMVDKLSIFIVYIYIYRLLSLFLNIVKRDTWFCYLK